MTAVACPTTLSPLARGSFKGLVLRACLSLALSLAGLAETRAIEQTDSTAVTRPSSPRGQTVDPRIFEVLELVPTRPVQASLSQQTPVLPTPSLAGLASPAKGSAAAIL